MKIVIVDYGVGNLLSLKYALEKTGLSVEVGFSKQLLREADAVALPGVGSFPSATIKLDTIRTELLDIINNGVPLLGICLGLQLFFSESEEGTGRGLGLFRGKNVYLPRSVKVPHMGWNTLRIVKQSELLDGIADGAYVYFVHSLYPMVVDKEILCAETEYGVKFASMVARNNVYGMQFHPEKSGDIGLQILRNFAKLVVR
ncbi:MAG: imidazole glycerol phosphate synthase subunit HisH [Candidatus Bathyarchaeia archaeon]